MRSIHRPLSAVGAVSNLGVVIVVAMCRRGVHCHGYTLVSLVLIIIVIIVIIVLVVIITIIIIVFVFVIVVVAVAVRLHISTSRLNNIVAALEGDHGLSLCLSQPDGGHITLLGDLVLSSGEGYAVDGGGDCQGADNSQGDSMGEHFCFMKGELES